MRPCCGHTQCLRNSDFFVFSLINVVIIMGGVWTVECAIYVCCGPHVGTFENDVCMIPFTLLNY